MRIEPELLDILSGYLCEKLNEDDTVKVRPVAIRKGLELLLREDIDTELSRIVEYVFEKLEEDFALNELTRSISKAWEYYEVKAKLIQVDYAVLKLTGKTRGSDVE